MFRFRGGAPPRGDSSSGSSPLSTGSQILGHLSLCQASLYFRETIPPSPISSGPCSLLREPSFLPMLQVHPSSTSGNLPVFNGHSPIFINPTSPKTSLFGELHSFSGSSETIPTPPPLQLLPYLLCYSLSGRDLSLPLGTSRIFKNRSFSKESTLFSLLTVLIEVTLITCMKYCINSIPGQLLRTCELAR